MRFDAAVLAAGTGDDELVAQLFAGATGHPSYGVAARYHRARTLERLGRIDEARAEYREVIARDDARLAYYALWARARLRELSARPPQPVAQVLPIGVSCAEVGPYTPVPDEIAGKIDHLGGAGRDLHAAGPAHPGEPGDRHDHRVGRRARARPARGGGRGRHRRGAAARGRA
ncbi:MAG: hypothetical protein M5U28_02880 [Sandaracinaceae bacterium]|nr:hypothetical protein [Sandaracinaceae bacterium]